MIRDVESLEEHLARLGYRQGEVVDSIRRYDISAWICLDKRHFTLGDGPGRSYLPEFRQPCDNLAFGNSLVYGTTVGSSNECIGWTRWRKPGPEGLLRRAGIRGADSVPPDGRPGG